MREEKRRGGATLGRPALSRLHLALRLSDCASRFLRFSRDTVRTRNSADCKVRYQDRLGDELAASEARRRRRSRRGAGSLARSRRKACRGRNGALGTCRGERLRGLTSKPREHAPPLRGAVGGGERPRRRWRRGHRLGREREELRAREVSGTRARRACGESTRAALLLLEASSPRRRRRRRARRTCSCSSRRRPRAEPCAQLEHERDAELEHGRHFAF